MIACVHQPNFLPWMGFFAKIAAADIYVVMDNVQFPRNSWVNRVRIGGRGDPMWLTVPVRHSGRLELPIAEVEISYESDWVSRHLTTIQQRYARAPFFRKVFEALQPELSARTERLAERNLTLIRRILELFGIERRVVIGSQLQSNGSSSALIVAMCHAVGATTYLAGAGATYDDLSLYASAGIEHRGGGFVHPEYAQVKSSEFEPGLSIVDALFNVGPERTREMVLSSMRLAKEFVA